MTELEQIIATLKTTGRLPVKAHLKYGAWILRAGMEMRFGEDGLALASQMAAKTR